MTATIQIEKNFPIPPGRRGRPVKYPWYSMEIGDSFLPTEKCARATAYAASQRYAPKKFIYRKVDGGGRIWRIA